MRFPMFFHPETPCNPRRTTSAVRKIQRRKIIKNQKVQKLIQIEDWSKTSLNTNPHGDKSTTARFVVPFIPSYTKNSKTEHTPKFKMHTQHKKPISKHLNWKISWGVNPHKIFKFYWYFNVFYWVCILNFGLCSVFEFLAYEGMNGTTNLAVVDLSPYGFVFKELALQSLILNAFLSFLFFIYFVKNHFAHSRNHFARLDFMGG